VYGVPPSAVNQYATPQFYRLQVFNPCYFAVQGSAYWLYGGGDCVRSSVLGAEEVVEETVYKDGTNQDTTAIDYRIRYDVSC